MQSRKLSVKTFHDLTLADSLRAGVVVHKLTEDSQQLAGLFVLRPPITFLEHGAEVAPTKIKSGVDPALGADSRPA